MVETVSGVPGVSVAVLPFTPYVAETTAFPASLKIKVDALIVVTSRALLNTALRLVPGATPVALLAGVVAVTPNGTGPVASVALC